MAALLANTAVDELSSVGRKIYHNALNRRQLPYITQHGCTLGNTAVDELSSDGRKIDHNALMVTRHGAAFLHCPTWLHSLHGWDFAGYSRISEF